MDVDGGSFEHRGAVMQEARFVIDSIAPKANYEHHLMGYNNDPHTTFGDIQHVLELLERDVESRLEGPQSAPIPATAASVPPTVTAIDIQVAKRVEGILASPANWNRNSSQECFSNAQTFGLYCALEAASLSVTGKFDENSTVMTEARHAIGETAPNAKRYHARLVDYNNDPTTSFEYLRKMLHLVEERLTVSFAKQQSP